MYKSETLINNPYQIKLIISPKIYLELNINVLKWKAKGNANKQSLSKEIGIKWAN